MIFALRSIDIDKNKKTCCDSDSTEFKKIENSAKFLKVVSDTNRIKILCILSKEKVCVCDLAKRLKIAQNLVSHHLKVLEDIEILEKKRVSNQIFYSIIPEKKSIVEDLKQLIAMYQINCTGNL